VAGTGITLTYDDSAGSLTVSGQQGDITGIVAGALVLLVMQLQVMQH
jgi:phage baseplate assembly protein gpV